jgi:hypothetical protein
LKPENEIFDVGQTFHAVFDHLNLNWINGGFDTAGFVDIGLNENRKKALVANAYFRRVNFSAGMK